MCITSSYSVLCSRLARECLWECVSVIALGLDFLQEYNVLRLQVVAITPLGLDTKGFPLS